MRRPAPSPFEKYHRPADKRPPCPVPGVWGC